MGINIGTTARLMVRKVLEQQKGNVSKTAKIFGINRKTVRRAKERPPLSLYPSTP